MIEDAVQKLDEKLIDFDGETPLSSLLIGTLRIYLNPASRKEVMQR